MQSFRDVLIRFGLRPVAWALLIIGFLLFAGFVGLPLLRLAIQYVTG